MVEEKEEIRHHIHLRVIWETQFGEEDSEYLSSFRALAKFMALDCEDEALK